jgi:hypothetical protein
MRDTVKGGSAAVEENSVLASCCRGAHEDKRLPLDTGEPTNITTLKEMA